MGLIHNGNGEMIPGERGGKVRPCESAWQEPDDRSEQLPRSQRPATQKFFIRPTILAGTVAGGHDMAKWLQDDLKTEMV